MLSEYAKKPGLFLNHKQTRFSFKNASYVLRMAQGGAPVFFFKSFLVIFVRHYAHTSERNVAVKKY